MITTTPWINFNGNAEEALTFYKSVFGGEFTKCIRFKDLSGPEFPVQDVDKEKIMYLALSIGKDTMLIANDVPDFLGKVNENENRSKIRVCADSKEEANRIYRGLSSDGSVEVSMSDSPWGTYFGMFRDRYGIEWVIECASRE